MTWRASHEVHPYFAAEGAGAGGAADSGTAGAAGAGQGGAGGSSGGAAAGDGGGDKGGAAGGGTEGGGKADSLNPYKVPDKFLTEGRPDYGKLVQSYGDAEKALMRKTTEVRAEVERAYKDELTKRAPTTPADYKVEDKFILGDREIQMKADDPMMGFVRQLAHANHWTQDEFNQNVRSWVAGQLDAMPKWNAEAAKLGPQADARHKRVDGFLRSNLSAESYQVFATQPATAALIKAVEEVMELTGHPRITDDTTAIPSEALTRDQLREMQRDPRYTGERGKDIDPSFVARVRAGYRALAKNGSGR